MTIQTVPISDFKMRQTHVLSLLRQAPVYLMQRSKATAVMVSVDQWQQVTTRLRNFELLELARQRKMEIERDPIGELVSDEELERQIAAKVAG